MSDERWLRAKALFEAALESPTADRTAFLKEATGSDLELRREVESLLAADADGDSNFLVHLQGAVSAVLAVTPSLGAASIREGRPILSAGQRIGAYEIDGLLGVGGMGEVYRAHDQTLNRDVAIKVLPAVFALDPNRLARFRREAQMLASLNHPNVGAIYGFEQSGGVDALVLELVDGTTLADRLTRGALPLEAALAIAQQIAGAVEAAHDKGIVHRDLKPANIKIDSAGAVKVLDFGLAKAIIPEGSSSSPVASHEGVILGTASYMSPEQARGLAVDKRTDIWAFGCVLYEMLTGRQAFPGETISDTIVKILEREPDWSALPASTPAWTRRMLRRCLSKDQKQRIRDIGDVRLEIETIGDLPDAAPGTGRPRSDGGSWLPWLAVCALAAAVLVWEASRAANPADNPLADARFSLFTNWEGNEEGAEISPNGELVAFLSDRDGEFDLWVKQVGTDNFFNLTAGLPPLVGSGFIVRKLGFTADSAEIWFNAGDGKPPARIPVTGHALPKPFLPVGTNTPAWSPDGKSLVSIYKANRDDPMHLRDASGADPHEILGPGPLKNMNPVFSLDNKWIYFGRSIEPQDETEMDVWRLSPSGGTPERITRQHLAINFLAPLDLRRMLYVARDEDHSGPWLWSLDVNTGTSTRVPTGSDQYMSVSASRDGRRIVATVANPSASLWEVPLRDHPVDEREARPYTIPVPTGFAHAPRFDKEGLFFLTERGTGDGLWRGTGRQAITGQTTGGWGVVGAGGGVVRRATRGCDQKRGEATSFGDVGGRNECSDTRGVDRDRGRRGTGCGRLVSRRHSHRRRWEERERVGTVSHSTRHWSAGPLAGRAVGQSRLVSR